MGDGAPARAEGGSASRKPADVAFKQQRMKSWQPILDPKWVVAAYILIGIAFVPSGIVMRQKSNDIVELSAIYESHLKDGTKVDVSGCEIGNNPNAMYLDEQRTCEIKMEVGDRDMTPPVLVYYELNNFYQNYRKYMMSKDLNQLTGSLKDQDEVSAENCEPLNKIGDITIYPCGLIANTLFNDVIKLKSVTGPDGEEISAPMIETGVAWQSDLDYKFMQPEKFHFEKCSDCASCDCFELNAEGVRKWSCKEPYVDEDQDCHTYFYPNDESTQYLYETYPMVINPLEGVTNEHFVVWMRVAALPHFRKLYGYINEEIPAGSTLTFDVMANFAVERSKASKALIVSTNNLFGGKNEFLGLFFIIGGGISLGLGALISLKMIISPRKLGDPSYLRFKAE